MNEQNNELNAGTPTPRDGRPDEKRIWVFHLTTGDEIVGETEIVATQNETDQLDEDGNPLYSESISINLIKPCRIISSMTDKGKIEAGLIPYMMYVRDEKIGLNPTAIVSDGPADPNLARSYMRSVSDIIIPDANERTKILQMDPTDVSGPKIRPS